MPLADRPGNLDGVGILLRYTLARLVLFGAAFGLVWLVAFNWLEWNSLGILWTTMIALAISSVAALIFLRGMRDELAEQMRNHTSRLGQRIDRARRAEDVD